jgi:hypothetical protein
MIKSNALVQTQQLATGQYATVVVGFVSDEMLTDGLLRFNPGFYSVSEPGEIVGVAFQLLYPESPGEYEFDKINCKNHIAFLKVVDAYNFEVEFRFVASRNINGWVPDAPHVNATALNTTDESGDLTFGIRWGEESCVARVPIEIMPLCEPDVAFEIDGGGYVPNEDLKVTIKPPSGASNGYYAAFINADAINNKDNIFPGLFMNYAHIGGGVTQVEDLPSGCFKSGKGFMEKGTTGEAFGEIIVNGECLKPGTAYQLLIVYYTDGVWKSCLSERINQKSVRSAIIPKVTYSITDDFGNITANACVKGLSNLLPVSLCLTIDTADFSNKLREAGYEGGPETYFNSAKAFVGKGTSSFTGIPLELTGSFPTFCVNDFKTKEAVAAIVIQIKMSYPEYNDYLNFAFELVYNGVEIETEAIVMNSSGRVYELCEGGDYTIEPAPGPGCLTFVSVNGSDYVESDIIVNGAVNESLIGIGAVVCAKVVCDKTVIIIDGGCECPCPEIRLTRRLVARGDGSFLVAYKTDVEGTATYTYCYIDKAGNTQCQNGSNGNTSLESSFETQSGNNPEDLYEVVSLYVENYMIEYEGCTYLYVGDTINSSFTEPGYEETTTTDIILKPLTETVECDCEETEKCENTNYAGLDFDCNRDTETITLNLVKTINSEIETEDFLLSTDGGYTFVPCPDTIVGARSVFVTYDATFTDGCEPIHFEQVISCYKRKEYANARTLVLEDVGGILEITITDTFRSEKLTDILKVSLDAGLTYQEFDLLREGYTPKIELDGTENVVAYTLTQFDDGFVDYKTTRTLKPRVVKCEYDPALTLVVSYDESAKKFSVETIGTTENFEVDEIRWTLNGGNPYDENNTGIKYTEPVKGEGLFVATRKLKKRGCEPIFIDAVDFVKTNTNITINNDDDDENIINVNVRYPDNTINVNVINTGEGECNDEYYITAENNVLTVIGNTTNAEIKWTGPNDFVGMGKVITVVDDGVYFATIRKDNCMNTVSVEIVNGNTPPCAGYGDYSLAAIYDEVSGMFMVSTTGDILPLEDNELLWTLNGGNPFDSNGSGIPYLSPVEGEGIFIVRWRIKLPNCPARILDALAFGKKCVALCEDATINVKFPDGPIEMCIVECCDETWTLECVDHVLSVVGDLTDTTITWTGPNGFTGTGDSVTIEDEGTYYANIKKTGCDSTISYNHVHVSAGDPIEDEIQID